MSSSILAILSADSGGIFVFPFESIYYIGIISIILILFYRGNSLFRLLKNMFWYVSDTKSNINYNLKFIRNVKKILAMIIFGLPLLLSTSLKTFCNSSTE